MSLNQEIRVEGGARLRRTLRKAGTDMRDVTRLHRRVGDIIAPRAKAYAPVGPPVGGHIRNSIRATAAQSHSTIRVGDKAKPYGGPIHFGWPARNIRPNPWVTFAARESEPQWAKEYMDGITKLLDQVKGK